VPIKFGPGEINVYDQEKTDLIAKILVDNSTILSPYTFRDVFVEVDLYNTTAMVNYLNNSLRGVNLPLRVVTNISVSLGSIEVDLDGFEASLDRLAEPGDIARPGVPLLVLYDPGSLRLEVPVMENLAVKLKIGDKLTVHIDALDRDVEATVDEIVPQAEAASRSFLVKMALPRSEGLYEGMFGRLRIPAGRRRHLCLPTAAIQQVGQLQFVDVVQSDGKTLERRLVTTGRLGMPGRIEVLSGVEAGDRVLLRPEAEGHQIPEGKASDHFFKPA